MTDAIHSFPGFYGWIGEVAPIHASTCTDDSLSEQVWRLNLERVNLWVRGVTRNQTASWSEPDSSSRLYVFVWGRPAIASDPRFDSSTDVQRFSPAELPQRIARLYERAGAEAFALLEGTFSLILHESESRRTYLVVDKYGCDDIFVRQGENGLAFASHPGFLLSPETKLNAVPVAFFLAQEGFVPAPFTFFEGIRTIGRARFLQVQSAHGAIQAESGRCKWPTKSREVKSTKEAVEILSPLLERAIEAHAAARAGILLSGGADSSLLLNLAARNRRRELLALTGTVKGNWEGEEEIRRARELSEALGVEHEAVVVDPDDEDLPGEWERCARSWMSGTRITLPLFLRFGTRLRERFGDGFVALSGQMADTLADNNYTLSSPGYLVRRALFSPFAFAALPAVRRFAPKSSTRTGKWLIRQTGLVGGTRVAGMFESLLDGANSTQRWCEGRVFGYGEMPGRSRTYFPALSGAGFSEVADWYSDNFVRPVVTRLRAEHFYGEMIELSFDMVMLHLDTRLVFHAFRMKSGNAALPFLDARVVNYFATLPRGARAIYRPPKHVIRAQFPRQGMKQPSAPRHNATGARKTSSESMEEILLRGTLGAHFREVFSEMTWVARVPAIFDLIDERYLFDQVRAFREGRGGVSLKFISRLAALEAWSRSLSRPIVCPVVCATA